MSRIRAWENANNRDSKSHIRVNSTSLEWGEEEARPCAIQTLSNGSIYDYSNGFISFCFVVVWLGLCFFSTLKHNIVCFTFLLFFFHPLSLKVDNYTGCGLIS